MPEIGTTDPGAGGEQGRPSPPARVRRHILSRRRKYLTWTAIALLGSPLVPPVLDGMDFWTGQSETEQHLSAAMSTEFGLTTVTCSSRPGRVRDILGQPPAVTEHAPFTSWYSWMVHARHDTCDAADNIGSLNPADGTRVHQTGLAITALAVEGERTQDETDAGTALCYALQRSRNLMRDLGATVAIMDAVQADVANSLHNHDLVPYSDIPRPDGCHDGGSLDLDPANVNPPAYFG